MVARPSHREGTVANKKVTIWKSIRLGEQWRYARPVVAPNGKIKPGWVCVNGHEEHHPEGQYFLHFLQGKKQIWEKAGSTPTFAKGAAERKESLLRAVASGIALQPEFRTPLLLRDALYGYLEEYRLSQRPESYNLMKQTLEEWLAFSRKYVAHDVKRIDLLQYKEWLIKTKRPVRTAGNKMLRVNQFLRTILKLKPGEGLVTVRDAKYVELEPTVYNDEELEKFFAACNPFQLAVFKTLLMSGLRKQELENLTWNDVDFTAGTLKVSAKAGFEPKTWEERTVEVPSDLLKILKTLPRRGDYVFTTKTGGRWTHAWDDAQEIGKAAGVKDAHPHKFRATYATRLLQSGIDLKTVQRLLGHKNLESTMRYLAKAESKTVRAKVDSVFNGRH